MNGLKKYLTEIYIDSKAKTFQDVELPDDYATRAESLGLNSTQSAELAAQVWDEWVSGTGVTESVLIARTFKRQGQE